MTIPIPVIMGVLSLVQAEARSRSQRSDERARVEFERERLQEEIAAVDRQANRQKTVLLRMIESAEKVHQLKVEAILDLFREAKGLLEGHQAILAEEKTAMNKQLVQTQVSAQQHVMILKRQAEIDRQLTVIDEKLGELMEICVEVISGSKPELGHIQIERLVLNRLQQKLA